jgi:hypothetical protein
MIRLTGRGNLTFDSLALDNLVAGDEESIQGMAVGRRLLDCLLSCAAPSPLAMTQYR